MIPSEVQPFLDLIANPSRPYFLIIAALIGLGYVIQQVEFIPNRFIPAVLFLVSVVVTPILTQLEAGIPGYVLVTSGVLQGILYAGFAWLIHNRVIKALEKWGRGSDGRTDARMLLGILGACLGVCGWAVFTISCVSHAGPPKPPDEATQSLVANPEQNANFVRDVQGVCDLLSMGGTVALQAAVKGQERQEYARLLSGSGHVYEALATGAVPTESQVKGAYSAYFPSSAENHVNLANISATLVAKLPAIIGRYLPASYRESAPAVYAAYVNYALLSLARTAYQTADPFLE